MLRGTSIALRARHAADVAVLHAELYEDVAVRTRADSRAWRPVVEAWSPYVVGEPRDDVSFFSVLELATGELAGEALLWGIDRHNRLAHIGISLRPSMRGRGLGTDTTRLLCSYGFSILGLHRLQVETLAENTAMIRAATEVGFVTEGVLRRNAWVNGDFLDEVIMGLLATEFPSAKDRSGG